MPVVKHVSSNTNGRYSYSVCLMLHFFLKQINTIIYTGRLQPEVQPLSFLYQTWYSF